jgi:FtsZ-binding cell division protein ZapB
MPEETVDALVESNDLLQEEVTRLRETNTMLRRVNRALRRTLDSLRNQVAAAAENDETFRRFCQGEFDSTEEINEYQAEINGDMSSRADNDGAREVREVL